MTPKELSQLKRWQVEGLYWSAEKCAGDLSRGCAGLQGERDNLLAENKRLRAALIFIRDKEQAALNEAERLRFNIHEDAGCMEILHAARAALEGTL